MRLIFTLLFLSLGAFSYGQNEAETTCNIDTYRDYIYTHGNHQCDFRGASLRGANFTNANLLGADFSEASLRGANFTNADLTNARLTGARLTGARLTGANFQGAYLPGADLRWVIFYYADFSEANLRGAKVRPSLATYLKAQGVSGFVVENE